MEHLLYTKIIWPASWLVVCDSPQNVALDLLHFYHGLLYPSLSGTFDKAAIDDGIVHVHGSLSRLSPLPGKLDNSELK